MNKKLLIIGICSIFLIGLVCAYVPDPFGDYDKDSVLNRDDNCYFVWNPLQIDSDGDGIGDVCDPSPFEHEDNPEIPDDEDNGDDDGQDDEDNNENNTSNVEEHNSIKLVYCGDGRWGENCAYRLNVYSLNSAAKNMPESGAVENEEIIKLEKESGSYIGFPGFVIFVFVFVLIIFLILLALVIRQLGR